MGEAQEWLFEPTFNRAVKVCASDERITSDAGLVLLREADHRLGLTEWLAQGLFDPRRQDMIRYQLVELLRERVYALAQGYSAQDDADRLAHDPAMKMAVWNRPGCRWRPGIEPLWRPELSHRHADVVVEAGYSGFK